MERHSFLSVLQVSYYEGDYMKEVSRERYLAWGRCEYRILVRRGWREGSSLEKYMEVGESEAKPVDAVIIIHFS